MPQDKSSTKFSNRYNYTKEIWERSPVGSGEWEQDKDREFEEMTDQAFIREWHNSKSIASMARHFGRSHKSIYHKRIAVNDKIRKAYKKPKDWVALKQLPKFTETEELRRQEIDNKQKGIKDIVDNLPLDVRKAMGLA